MRQPPHVFYGHKVEGVNLADLLRKPFTRHTLQKYWQVTVPDDALYKLATQGLVRLLQDRAPQVASDWAEDIDAKKSVYWLPKTQTKRFLWYEIIEEKRPEAIEALKHLDAIARLGG